jgi:hypothetical protein
MQMPVHVIDIPVHRPAGDCILKNHYGMSTILGNIII